MKKSVLATLFVTALFIASLLFISLFAPLAAQAQVYNCNGVYKNTPCDTAAANITAVPAKSKEAAEDKKALSRKKSILHDLSMKVLDARRDYKLNYNIDAIEELCLRTETSVADCSDKANELSEKIDNRTASLESIKAQKKANELQEQKLKEEKDEPEVTIIQQDYYVVATPTPRFWIPRPHQPHVKPAEPPIDKLQTYRPDRTKRK